MKLVTMQRLSEEAVRNIVPEIELVQVAGEEALLGASADADIVIGSFGVASGANFERLLQVAKRVRWIHTSRAGVDNLLTPEFLARDIILTCGKGYAAGRLLAEHAFALILARTRAVAVCARLKTWGENAPLRKIVFELGGKTMGLVGFGGVGTALARRAIGFEMNVLAVKRTPSAQAIDGVAVWGMDRFDELLARSDVVVVSVPLTSATKGMFGRSAFSKMKPGAILVNVGRGEVVDTAALIDALREGRLGGAGLDVFEQEPLPDDSPLWAMENVVITPHLSGASTERAARNLETILENIRRFVEGRPLLSAVDTTTGY
ncbi:MAG: D-2-hydroxyacid dehydrogenase [Pseudomonadota bacterium]